MNNLEKVEKLTKALQEGKTLVSNYREKVQCKIINGFICKIFEDGTIGINETLYNSSNWQIQESEPEFEITENQLAEYECRDGSKAVCYGEFHNGICSAVYLGKKEAKYVSKNGKIFDTDENPQDLILKIRDL